MACERNRKLKKYIESCGISVNIGKNKARGNKGFFKFCGGTFRIDVAENLDDEAVSSVLLHEFAHFIHYRYDKSLKKLDFVFGELSDDIEEELINVTVDEIPKAFASNLFAQKELLKKEIRTYASLINSEYQDFKLSESCKKIEQSIKIPAKYLLKYDRIKLFGNVYSVENAGKDFGLTPLQEAYIVIKSKKRAIARINSKISKLNRYYNSPSELFARFAALYFLNREKTFKLAPLAGSKIKVLIEQGKIPEFTMLDKILN